MLLEGDAAYALAKLKQEDGPELQAHGSANLIQTLLRHSLVDRFRMFMVGTGSGCSATGTIHDRTVVLV